MNMRTITIVLVCFAGMGHSTLAESRQPDSNSNDGLAALSMLLLGTSPAVAFNSFGGRPLTLQAKRALAPRTTTLQMLKIPGSNIIVDVGEDDDEDDEDDYEIEEMDDWDMEPTEEEIDAATDQVIFQFNDEMNSNPFTAILQQKREFLNKRNRWHFKQGIKNQRRAEYYYDQQEQND